MVYKVCESRFPPSPRLRQINSICELGFIRNATGVRATCYPATLSGDSHKALLLGISIIKKEIGFNHYNHSRLMNIKSPPSSPAFCISPKRGVVEVLFITAILKLAKNSSELVYIFSFSRSFFFRYLRNTLSSGTFWRAPLVIAFLLGVFNMV